VCSSWSPLAITPRIIIKRLNRGQRRTGRVGPNHPSQVFRVCAVGIRWSRASAANRQYQQDYSRLKVTLSACDRGNAREWHDEATHYSPCLREGAYAPWARTAQPKKATSVIFTADSNVAYDCQYCAPPIVATRECSALSKRIGKNSGGRRYPAEVGYGPMTAMSEETQGRSWPVAGIDATSTEGPLHSAQLPSRSRRSAIGRRAPPAPRFDGVYDPIDPSIGCAQHQCGLGTAPPIAQDSPGCEGVLRCRSVYC